jgi:glycosyltransferase involved in cell wall biosynthesis
MEISSTFITQFGLILCDFLQPAFDIFINTVQHTGGYLNFGFVVLFTVGIIFDLTVFALIRIGVAPTLSVRYPKPLLNAVFWLRVVWPTLIVLVLSTLSFAFLLLPDYNLLDLTILRFCPLIICLMLGYLWYNYVTLNKPVGQYFSLIQSLFIVLSDVPCGVLAIHGWSVSILLMVTINVLVTIFAYHLAQSDVHNNFLLRLNQGILQMGNSIFIFFNICLQKQTANVEFKYSCALYSVLLSSKTLLWTCGAFYGPFHQFGRVSLAGPAITILGLIWVITTLMFVYYGALSCHLKKQRLSIPWEPLITFQNSPAPHIGRVILASYCYLKIRGYQKFLRSLRQNYKSDTPGLAVKMLYRILIPFKAPYKDITANTFTRIQKFVLRRLIRQCAHVYALCRVMLDPLVLVGKPWIENQIYFINLPLSLDISCNVASAQASKSTARAVWDVLPHIATVTGVTGLTMAAIFGEWSVQQLAMQETKAIPVAQNIASQVGTAAAKQSCAGYEKSVTLAAVHRLDSHKRQLHAAEADKHAYDLVLEAKANAAILATMETGSGNTNLLKAAMDELKRRVENQD